MSSARQAEVGIHLDLVELNGSNLYTEISMACKERGIEFRNTLTELVNATATVVPQQDQLTSIALPKTEIPNLVFYCTQDKSSKWSLQSVTDGSSVVLDVNQSTSLIVQVEHQKTTLCYQRPGCDMFKRNVDCTFGVNAIFVRPVIGESHDLIAKELNALHEMMRQLVVTNQFVIKR